MKNKIQINEKYAIPFYIGMVVNILTSWLLSKVDFITSFTQKHYEIATSIIVFLIFLSIFLFLQVITNKNGKFSIPDLSNYKLISKENKRHSIVLIDNEIKFRRTYQGLLRKYDTTVLEDIEDYRLLDSFDIIVTDMIGVGKDNLEGVHTILRQIKQRYPFKYIIAISNMEDEINNCESADAKICKSVPNFNKTLEKAIDKALKLFDSPDTYWEDKVKVKIPIDERENQKRMYEMYQFQKAQNKDINIQS